jgi:tRNA(adenine34) deaminase
MDLSPGPLLAHWSVLSASWQHAFTLAWESFCAGDAGVGAVVVDPSGAVVASGRTRRRDRSGAPGELAGNNLAHAEVNALIKLPTGSYSDHALLTTLEPCLLCSAAARMSHLGRVEFAAADPVWRGVERLPELNPHIARRWPARVGPADGPLSQWAALLPLVTNLEAGKRGAVVDQYWSELPQLMAVAQRIAGGGHLAALREHSLLDALEAVHRALAGAP